MKRYLLINLCMMIICAVVSAQNVMVVEKNDNSTTKFNIDDVKRVYFEDNSSNPNVNPSSSALYSRLKDKYGNSVLLTSTNADDIWDTWGYSYASDGRLAIFGELDDSNSEEHFVVDGLTFKSEHTSNSGSTERFNGSLELNQDGLITKAVVVFIGNRANGQIKDEYSMTHSFVYNAERQLIKVDVETKDDRYDENGNLSRSGSGLATLTYTWVNGNLLKVDITEDEGSLDHLYHNKEYTYSYGDVQNVARQPLKCQNHLASDFGINHLHSLGLFGVGPSNVPSGVSVTFNENGTINTEDNARYTYAEP